MTERSLPGTAASLGTTGDNGQFAARGDAEFVSRDARVAELFQLIALVADTDATVLIVGETGTGKELIAREIVRRCVRRRGAFVAVNCAAIPETLQESELFGHVQGAFTGADRATTGRFEAADGGTIFLDEISETSRLLQSKLLRVLQSGEYTPVGAARPRYCDVRVIAATNRSLERMIASHEFRPDLYYRLNIICLEIPPLRERRGDVALLVDHFVRKFCSVLHKPTLPVAGEALALLAAYPYPGNVRELENLVFRAVVLCQGERIGADHLPIQVRGQPAAEPTAESAANPASFHAAKAAAVAQFEREYLTEALAASGGLINRAARRIGLSERNFHAKLRKYRISSRTFRAG